MSADRTPIDRIRDLAEGRLAPEEARALEEEVARDPELRAAAEAYAAVHAATDAVRGEPPASRLGWDDVSREGAPGRGRWVVAAAAVLLLGVGLGLALLSREAPVSPVELAAVPLSAAPSAPPPALVGDWRPVVDGRLRWIGTLAEGRAVARFTNRPVLVYGMYPGCPMCREMERGALADPAVAEAASRFVPVRLDASRMSEEEAASLFQEGWPYLVVETPDGRRIEKLSGMHEAPALRARLDAAWDARPQDPSAPVEWADAAKAALRAARAGEAREALLAARDLASTDPALAETRLREAAERLAGTPFGEDLARVLDRWRADGRFPPLEEKPR